MGEREGKKVITQRQVRITAKTIAAMLVLGAALTLGGAAGYVLRGQVEAQAAAPTSPRIVNPGIGQHRLDSMDASDPEPGSPTDRTGRITTTESTRMVNPGIGQHRLEAYNIDRP
jgi:hypothetical protein